MSVVNSYCYHTSRLTRSFQTRQSLFPSEPEFLKRSVQPPRRNTSPCSARAGREPRRTTSVKNRRPLPTLGNQIESERRRLRRSRLPTQSLCQTTERNEHDRENNPDCNPLPQCFVQTLRRLEAIMPNCRATVVAFLGKSNVSRVINTRQLDSSPLSADPDFDPLRRPAK